MKSIPIPPIPRNIGVPHDNWLPLQLEALEFILWRKDRFILVEAATGVGKTTLSASVGPLTNSRVTAVTQSLALQQQYKDPYGFYRMQGRRHYRCAYLANFTADDCVFPKVNRCPDIADCEYYRAKRRAKKEPKLCMNYAYYLLSRWPHERGGWLVLDEAHGIENAILSYAAITISRRQRREFSFPEFPMARAVTLHMDRPQPWMEVIIKWVRQCTTILRPIASTDEDALPHNRRAAKLLRKLEHSLSLLRTGRWFIESGEYALSDGDRATPGFRARPLSPKPYARLMYTGFDKVLLMSATLEPKATAELLDIDDYEAKRFPHPLPVAERNPIHALDCPRMSQAYLKKHPRGEQQQAQAIVDFIENHTDPETKGVIFVSRWSETTALAQRLSAVTRRIWLPPRGSSEEQVDQFLRQPPGTVAITPSWRHGLDFNADTNIRWAVLAKVPFAFIGDPFERARMSEGKGGRRAYRWRAVMESVQALGRVRPPGGVLAIADGSWWHQGLSKMAPVWFQECIVK